MEKVNFSANWANLWSLLAPQLASILQFVGVIGIIIVVVSLITYAVQRRRGSGGNTSAVVGACILGAVLCSPQVLIPIVLIILDILINTVIQLVSMIS
jgi:ABC-type glycerol-3-phosphate transport system permease component